LLFPQFTPASPVLRPDPFDLDDYIFELKMNGFRVLANVGQDQTRLVSRRGNMYKSFPDERALLVFQPALRLSQ
jgi:ATP-dependent DNA ligase